MKGERQLLAGTDYSGWTGTYRKVHGSSLSNDNWEDMALIALARCQVAE